MEQTVELCRKGDWPIAEVARELDLTETAVRRWVHQAAIDAGQKPGLTSSEHEELVRLRKEVRVLREERDIMKRRRLFRQGDPVSMYPFIEAERAGRRSVNRACAVMKVSRAAYCEWCRQRPSARAREDRERSAASSAPEVSRATVSGGSAGRAVRPAVPVLHALRSPANWLTQH